MTSAYTDITLTGGYPDEHRAVVIGKFHISHGHQIDSISIISTKYVYLKSVERNQTK